MLDSSFKPVKREYKPRKNNSGSPALTPIPETTPIEETDSVFKEEKVTKEDCLKMLELLRTPTFMQMMGPLTAKEAVIISLILGYIDGKYFSTESIANFLGIEEKEVIESTKKVLVLYRDNLNSFLDAIIKLATKEGELKRVLVNPDNKE